MDGRGQSARPTSVTKTTKDESRSVSQVQQLFQLLVLIVVLLIGHLGYVQQTQAAALREYRATVDENGDKQISRQEIAAWFGANMGDGGSAAKFEGMVGKFDSNGDNVFNDGELRDFLDAMDEFPNVSPQIATLGGDHLEAQRNYLILLACVVCVVLLLLKVAIDRSARDYESIKKDMAQGKRALQSYEKEVAELKQDISVQKNEVEKLANAEYRDEERLSAAKAELREKESALSKAKSEMDVVKAEFSKVESKLGAAMSRLEKSGIRPRMSVHYTKPSRNQIKGSTPGTVAIKRLIATLDDDRDLWLDEDKVLGESRSKVMEITSVYTGEKRAMKKYENFASPDLIAELCACRDLPRHPNLMLYDKVIETDGSAFVIMEHLSADGSGMDLFELASLQKGISEALARKLFRGYFAGIAHLHNVCGVIHNDIKAENLYVLGASNEDDDRDAKTLLEKAHAKVIDLGMAMYPHGEPKRAEGAEAFAAPELLRSNFKTNSPKNAVLIEGPLPIATKEMDVYRLGVSLYQALHFKYPFNENGNYRVPLKFRYKGRRGEEVKTLSDLFPTEPVAAAVIDGRVSPLCQTFIKRCLAKVPAERPTAAEALNDAWFQTLLM